MFYSRSLSWQIDIFNSRNVMMRLLKTCMHWNWFRFLRCLFAESNFFSNIRNSLCKIFVIGWWNLNKFSTWEKLLGCFSRLSFIWTVALAFNMKLVLNLLNEFRLKFWRGRGQVFLKFIEEFIMLLKNIFSVVLFTRSSKIFAPKRILMRVILILDLSNSIHVNNVQWVLVLSLVIILQRIS